MKTFHIIYYLFFGFIGLIAILLLVSIFPISGNFKVLTVESGSMEPAIKMGSIVVIKPSESYKIGDTITFGEMTKTKSPITHRIFDIKMENGQEIYITKGDANSTPDKKEIKKADVIGKVLFDISYLGYAVSAVKKPLGFLLILIIPALLVIIDEVLKIKKELKKKPNATT